ncbi:ATP-binding protein [Nostoc sp. C117]|uniref:ATP-binding protein n=1 Tax=Nostoc sp. C117 TaxID=3349875 RepID=UPI00370D6892
MSSDLSTPKVTTENWFKANQLYLMRAIARVEKLLKTNIYQAEDGLDDQNLERWEEVKELAYISDNFQDDEENFSLPAIANETPSALEELGNIFDLSPFEQDILLLCAGAELDRNWLLLFIKLQDNPQQNYPTFSLALEVLPESHWSALMPNAPLRRWQLIEIGAGNTLTTSPLRIDERILHHLMGVQHLDERLTEIELPVSVTNYLALSHQQIAKQLTHIWLEASDETEMLPVLQLCGTEVATKSAIALTACNLLGLSLYAISAEAIPTNTNQLNLIKCLCEREWMLSDRVLMLDCDDLETMEASRNSAISRFIETINCPLIITSRDRRRQRQRPLITFDVHQPSSEEQQLIWQNALGNIAPSLQGHVETLVSYFSLSLTDIQTASLKVKSLVKKIEGQRDKETDESVASASPHLQLWDICRNQARPRLDELAQRIEPSANWNDLVLPEKEQRILHEIAAHVAQRTKVYEDWGFGGKSGRGLGISALFSGPSGTGKTTAAELLAKELRLDLYRIDLSSIVNKYIGETEKNLRRVFDAAETGGVILLFDEADALFGKRSEVKDSHDRYANMEVSYLLQRIESYRGLAILTTNLKTSIDQAFLRRLRFVVQFPFPDAKQRAEIWQRIFPSQTPTEGLDFTKLAQLSITGGNIRNIALNAAFIAANSGDSLGMKHILQATKSEYTKLERSLTDAEINSWV